jgi:ligand-binding sensor domain-containing protein/signal transduction histidine kinase
MGPVFRSSWGALVVWAGVCGIWPLLAAEMPARIYTTQDGLVRDDVNRIRRDSRGYLWFGTAEGLSVFDGYQFTNYTVNDGLPDRSVLDILETRSGEYWIATHGGLCRFDPNATPERRFTTYRLTKGTFAEKVNVLIERRDRSIWFGTEGGLWELLRSGVTVSAERIRLPSPEGDAQRIFALWEDRDSNLWVGASDGLYAIRHDRQVSRFADGVPDHDFTMDVFQDRQGRIWAATRQGVCRIAPHPADGRNFVERVYRIRPYPTALFESSDGKLWVAGWGLFQFNPEAPVDRDAFQRVALPFGGTLLESLAEDSDHNLWAAGSGALKVTRHGFTTFSTADGLEVLRIHALIEDRAGRLCAITSGNDGLTIHEFDGSRFTGVSPHLSPGFTYAWGDAQVGFQDHVGDWWVPTSNGVLRFAPPARIADLAHASPKAIYSTRDGLPDDRVLRLFEDSRRDVWIGVFRGLARWRRSTGQIQAYSVSDGLRYMTEQPPGLGTPQFLAEDRIGQIWIGFHPFGLARYRDGGFDFYTEAEGLPKGQINGLYSDHAGRLWIASSQGGAARIDDVTAPRPSFHTYTIAQGLSSNQIYAAVEDIAGRIYLAGGRGVDRLDPGSGSVRHFTSADGLPPVRVQYAMRDRAGALWFGSGLGLSRYLPEPDQPSEPPPPLIRGLRIAGRPSSDSVLGKSAVAGIRLPPAQNSLHIEFASLHFASGEVLRYQYRLEGADRDWSPLTDQRTVNYSNLSPGAYRFVVRAVNGERRASAQNASVSFVILPPVWRQAWFMMLMASGLGAMLYGAHRYRVTQVLNLERIRMRLASDLHDDIGSGLAEIAILTDVAGLQPVSAGGDLMRRAGDRARQLREAMSDIVWSVDPQHGNLTDLIGRVRQSVFSLMESNGTRVTFEGPEEGASLNLAPDRARHVLLITKEALTNVLKHADASEVSVRLKLEHRSLVLEVRDDGRGFDPKGPHAGMGLRNLRRRAAESGGELTIESSPGRGAKLMLSLPLGRAMPARLCGL